MALKPAPPRPTRHQIADMGLYQGRHQTEWEATGQCEFRASWLRGVVLWIEETRMVFRPRVAGHSPKNWTEAKRWRKATMTDLARPPRGGFRMVSETPG